MNAKMRLLMPWMVILMILGLGFGGFIIWDLVNLSHSGIQTTAAQIGYGCGRAFAYEFQDQSGHVQDICVFELTHPDTVTVVYNPKNPRDYEANSFWTWLEGIFFTAVGIGAGASLFLIRTKHVGKRF